MRLSFFEKIFKSKSIMRINCGRVFNFSALQHNLTQMRFFCFRRNKYVFKIPIKPQCHLHCIFYEISDCFFPARHKRTFIRFAIIKKYHRSDVFIFAVAVKTFKIAPQYLASHKLICVVLSTE